MTGRTLNVKTIQAQAKNGRRTFCAMGREASSRLMLMAASYGRIVQMVPEAIAFWLSVITGASVEHGHLDSFSR